MPRDSFTPMPPNNVIQLFKPLRYEKPQTMNREEWFNAVCQATDGYLTEYARLELFEEYMQDILTSWWESGMSPEQYAAKWIQKTLCDLNDGWRMVLEAYRKDLDLLRHQEEICND